jgi:hypothetical protein
MNTCTYVGKDICFEQTMCLQCKKTIPKRGSTLARLNPRCAHIWNNCNLSLAFESGQIHNDWLLGDSAYGIKPWLLTPV